MTKLPAPSVTEALWWTVPEETRLALGARLPLSSTLVDQSKALVVSVGSGTPLRWLMLRAVASGEILAQIHEVRPKETKLIAQTQCGSDALVGVLDKWADKLAVA